MKKIYILVLSLILCFMSIVPSHAAENELDISSVQDFISEKFPNEHKKDFIIYKPNFETDPYWLIVLEDYNNYLELYNAEYVTGINSSNGVYVNMLYKDGTTMRKAHFGYQIFRMNSDGSWSSNSNYFQEDNASIGWGPSHSRPSIYSYSTFNLTDNEGNVFFQVPPAGLEAVIQEEMTKASQEITQTMKIILLCGVGCLALLITLALFWKVLCLFQVI